LIAPAITLLLQTHSNSAKKLGWSVPHRGARSLRPWSEIIADPDLLTETEIEHEGKRLVIRSAPRPAASLALSAAGVALPPTVRQDAD
jgi:hypothetical protein